MGLMNRRKAKHCAVGMMIDERLATLNWQQQDLAFVLRCSVAYVSAIITGRKRLAADGATAFAAALNLSAYDILCAQSVELLANLPRSTAKDHAIQRRAAARMADG